MRTTIWILVYCFIFINLGCEDPDPSRLDDGSYVRISATPDTPVDAGSNNYITINVEVPLDGTGETCTFTATGGSFETKSGNKASTTSVVNISGVASTTWFPPPTPGIYKVTGTIKTLVVEKEITVQGVEAIIYTDLPSTVTLNSSTLFTLTVGKQWAGSAIEVKTTGGLLEATGPVVEELEKGTKIKPVVDQTGSVHVVYTAPSTAGNFQINASMFGTVSPKLITVQ